MGLELRQAQVLLDQILGKGFGFGPRKLIRWRLRPEVFEERAEDVGTEREHHQPATEAVHTHDHGRAEFLDQRGDEGHARVARQRRFERVGRLAADDHRPERPLPFFWPRAGGGHRPRSCRGGPHATRAGPAQRPQLVNLLQLAASAIHPEVREERRENLEHDGFQVRQRRNHVAADFFERLGDLTGVRVQPEALHLESAREVQLPHAIERQLRQKAIDGLAAVAFVAEDVVEIEQDAAVRALREDRQ